MRRSRRDGPGGAGAFSAMRRRVLAAGAALSAALLPWPRRAAADAKAGFAALTVDDALEAAFGRRDIPFSDAISIDLPDIAEDGSIVSIKVVTTLEEVTRISMLADNPVPLIAQFMLGPRTAPALSSRIKLAATTEVVVVVETAAACYQARRRVEVMQGGCS